MENKPLKLENVGLSNFDPTFLNNGQEMIFTLKDSNILDNNYGNNDIKNDLQIEEVKYGKDTGISIERYDENELLDVKKEKYDLEIQDDGQIIDENILLNKFNKIKNKIENKDFSTKKKFQEEFYNEEELKLLNKKKNRKKKNAIVLFDIDVNDEENKEDNKNNNEDNKKKEKEEDNININNNGNGNIFGTTKKSLFTLEDKEKLDNLFNNKKKRNESIVKKNVINIDENLLEEEENNDNIRINTDKNFKVIDDYAIFLDNLPNPKTKEETNKKEINEINTDLNNKNNDNDNKSNTEDINETEKDKKEEETVDAAEDEITFKQDDNIPLISDEPIIGKGVCVALQIFKNKKMLKNEEEFGRYHDKKYENITNEVNEEKKKDYDNNTLNIKDKDEYYKHKEINIEYRDENGKKLRPKEMARYQALIFHGEKSSVRKREKKLLREKYQVFVQNPSNNKTLTYMNFMKDKNHQAFATLQGKSSFL